jgi:hypothetical protein
MGAVHIWEFSLRAPPTEGCRKNEKRVPDLRREHTATEGADGRGELSLS